MEKETTCFEALDKSMVLDVVANDATIYSLTGIQQNKLEYVAYLVAVCQITQIVDFFVGLHFEIKSDEIDGYVFLFLFNFALVLHC